MIEDLDQEFFISILQNDCRKLIQFQDDGSCTLASFLRVVVSRLMIDHLRKQSTPTVEITDAFASDRPGAAEFLIDREEQKSLSQALETLSPLDRLIVHISYRQSHSPEEIAAILNG